MQLCTNEVLVMTNVLRFTSGEDVMNSQSGSCGSTLSQPMLFSFAHFIPGLIPLTFVDHVNPFSAKSFARRQTPK
jgi:hypothetical protein